MKFTEWLFVLIFGLISTPAFCQSDICDYYLPQCATKFDQYSKAAKQLDVQVKNKELSNLEAAQKAISLSDSLYPREIGRAHV